VVIVGAGFADFNAARELSSLVGATTEIVVINSTDYFLYLPVLLVAANPRSDVAGSTASRQRRALPIWARGSR
jgi:NADH dehydrogenase FAD-containing subunit